MPIVLKVHSRNLYHKIYKVANIADSCVDALKEIFGLPEDCLSGLRKISYKGR